MITTDLNIILPSILKNYGKMDTIDAKNRKKRKIFSFTLSKFYHT
jgi:hypothetical protein